MRGAYLPRVDPVLARAYANTAGAVAYLDETFHNGVDGRQRFYVFSAVLVERQDMEQLRNGLRQIAGGTFWHTTDELLTDNGRTRASQMLAFLGDGDEICVISHQARIDAADDDLEGARRSGLRALASTLSAGAHPLHGPIDLVVLEERNPSNLRNLDRKNIKAMRAEGLIHRSMQTVLTSPKYEHLLWLPDLVSSAFRRTLTHSDESLFSAIRPMVHFVERH